MTTGKTQPPDWMPDGVEMLTQPLVTEEGFLNEACVNELAASINDMPESFDRLSSEPEWSIASWVSANEIAGFLAHWAIVQAKGLPPGFIEVVGFVYAAVELDPRFDRWEGLGMYARLSLCDVNRLLWDVLGELQPFLDWNEAKLMGPYNLMWIDLSAILHNVCISLRDARRHDAAFNAKFEKEYQDQG